jgi:hypothetical protein
MYQCQYVVEVRFALVQAQIFQHAVVEEEIERSGDETQIRRSAPKTPTPMT